MKFLLTITTLLSINLAVANNSQAGLRSVKNQVSDTLDFCDTGRRSTIRCIKNEINIIESEQYSIASSRNNNRLICIIDTDYFDDDGDGWGWIPATQESCVVIGQTDTSKRAPQLDNSMDIYRGLKWLNRVKHCFENFVPSRFQSFDSRNNRGRKQRVQDKRRRGNRVVSCIEGQFNRRR